MLFEAYFRSLRGDPHVLLTLLKFQYLQPIVAFFLIKGCFFFLFFMFSLLYNMGQVDAPQEGHINLGSSRTMLMLYLL